MQYAWEKRDFIEDCGWTRMEGRDHLEELCVAEEGNILMDVLGTVRQSGLDSTGSGQLTGSWKHGSETVWLLSSR
jgi:hypothetical protein